MRPRFGGDGEGDGDIDLRGVEGEEGSIGDMEVAVGEIGVSRRSGGDRETAVALESCIVSKACMRALTADEAMVGKQGEPCVRCGRCRARRGRESGFGKGRQCVASETRESGSDAPGCSTAVTRGRDGPESGCR